MVSTQPRPYSGTSRCVGTATVIIFKHYSMGENCHNCHSFLNDFDYLLPFPPPPKKTPNKAGLSLNST